MRGVKSKWEADVKVIVTVPNIEDESAGPSYTVPALCKWLERAGAEVELHTLEKLPKRPLECKVRSYPRSANSLLRYLCWSPSMLKGFKNAAKSVDIIHVNGIWQLADIYPSRAVRGTNCKVVYCPRGGVSPTALWRGKTVIKKLMWYFGGQYRALKEAAMFHAASQKEHDELRALGFTQPIAIIPNGIDVPEIQHKPFTTANRKIAFFGRIHPTKAAGHLVEAWGRVAADFPEWSLEIVGPDCGAVPQLKAMIAEKNIPRVSLLGELKGMKKYEFLAQADLYVLPSLTENFGITIAEALVCGTPCIASKGCPWEGLVGNRCGWWIDIGPDALEKQLRESLNTPPSTLEEMGKRGKAWMEHDFVWSGIGRKMLAAYEWLVDGGERPEFVKEI